MAKTEVDWRQLVGARRPDGLEARCLWSFRGQARCQLQRPSEAIAISDWKLVNFPKKSHSFS